MTTPNTTTSRDAFFGALLVLAASVAFSSKAIMVKLAYAYDVNAETLIALRMAFAAPFFIALAVWVHVRANAPAISRRDAWGVLLLGSVGGYVPMWLDFAGLEYVTAGLERVILFLYPTMVVLISAWMFGQRVGRREVYALLVSYVGVVLAVGNDLAVLKSGAGQTLFGAGLVLVSALSYAGYLVASGRLIPRLGSSAFTAYTMLVAGVSSGVHFFLRSMQAPSCICRCRCIRWA